MTGVETIARMLCIAEGVDPEDTILPLPFTRYWRQAKALLDDPGLPEALAGAIGTVESRLLPVPVQVDRVPDYSCRPCTDGDHASCQPRVYYPDWQHECQCAQAVPHRRTGRVLVVPLAD